MFVDWCADDLIEAALGGFADEAGEVEDVWAGCDLVDFRIYGHLFDGFCRSQWWFEKEHVVAIFVWLLAEIFGSAFDDFFEFLNGDEDEVGLVVEGFGEDFFDLLSELGAIFTVAFKEHVAALDVGFDCA